MELKLFWTEFSQSELKSIYDYYREKAGHHIAKNLVNTLLISTYWLKLVTILLLIKL